MEEVPMARPLYAHELSDPDFQWLIHAYRETRGPLTVIEAGNTPVVLVPLVDPEAGLMPAAPPPVAGQLPEAAAEVDSE
jgi:hypothetical protein